MTERSEAWHQETDKKICFFGTYDRTFPRNYLLIRGLIESGSPPVICHEPLWENTGSGHTAAVSLLFPLRLLFMAFIAYFKLMFKFTRIGRIDHFVVGYPGFIDIIVLWLFKFFCPRNRRATIVFVPCTSVYDTVVSDRKLYREKDPRAKAAFFLDRTSLRLSNLVLADTRAYADYCSEIFSVGRTKFGRLFVGADDRVFVPARRENSGHSGQPFAVLFFGNYIPLHGIETIIEAINFLEGEKDIRFILMGSGQKLEEARSRLKVSGDDRVTIDTDAGRDNVARVLPEADLVLGVFGTSSKAENVIPNKIFITLAAGRPLLTAGTAGVMELLTDGENACFVPPGDAVSLADRIKHLSLDPEKLDHVARMGYELFLRRCTPSVLAEELINALRSLEKKEIE